MKLADYNGRVEDLKFDIKDRERCGCTECLDDLDTLKKELLNLLANDPKPPATSSLDELE
jgi:hypothetical protein